MFATHTIRSRTKTPTFIAPCIGEGWLQLPGTRVWRPEPSDFAGWGIFEQSMDSSAPFLRKAARVETDRFLRARHQRRLILVCRIKDRTWLAITVGTTPKAEIVHLVSTMAAPLTPIFAAEESGTLWFARLDPHYPGGEHLQRAFLQGRKVSRWRMRGATPAAKLAYALAIKGVETTRTGWQTEYSDATGEKKVVKINTNSFVLVSTGQSLIRC